MKEGFQRRRVAVGKLSGTGLSKSLSSTFLRSPGGWLLVAFGLTHFLVWTVVGGSWAGPVSFRKPVLFGISGGVTLISLSWVSRRLPPERWGWLWQTVVEAAMASEVALIALQFYRGVPSHFNTSTPFDSAINHWMTAFITPTALMSVWLTVRCLREPLSTVARDLRLGVRAGMILLSLSCGIGYVIAGYGALQVTLGEPPEIVGRAGVSKFPHGIAIHAIQFFPAISWLLMRLRVPERNRWHVMACLVASMSAMLMYSVIQTARGRARWDLDLMGAAIVVATAISCLYLLYRFANALRSHHNPCVSVGQTEPV